MNFLEEFESVLEKYSDNTAIVDYNGNRSTTYRQLDTLSRRVAAKLKRSGIKPGNTVLISMDRRMEYIAAEIGVMMFGAVFVPVLPDYPRERIEYIQKDCQASVKIDTEWMADIEQYEPAVLSAASDKDRVMIIYTSGSVGGPKGIAHSMDSFSQGIMRDRKAFYIDENDIMAAMAPMSFIAVLLEYFSVLTCGGCTHILAENIRKDVHLIEDYFFRNNITCAFISPQILKLFKNKSTSLKKVATGSERISMLSGDGYELYNFYGSSETATLAAYYKIDVPMENTPIGKPAEGLEFFLLDDNGREVAAGEEGELCIKGILADAYLNMEEQSSKTFYKQNDGKVLLHTGDIARKLSDGSYVYKNRKDWMVKINGQRVEIEEIELRLLSYSGVENAVVKTFDDNYGKKYLCAYYVSDEEISSEQFTTYLKSSLPDYMLPRFYKRLEKLPKNINNKLDRSVLLPPGIEEYKSEYVEPCNDTEKELCIGFEKILDCGMVGAADDFFKLGGDSINVLKLSEKLKSLYITPDIILRGRTPRKIADLLELGKENGPLKYDWDRKYYSLTDSQMGIYLEYVNDINSTMYNIPMCCQLPVDIDIRRFKDAVFEAVAMHLSFGVNITVENGSPVMFINKEFLRANVEEYETDDIEEVKRTFVKPFVLSGKPLYRTAVYKCKNKYYFLFDVHHLIFDGSSIKVFLDDISAIYKGVRPKAEDITMIDISVYEETLKDKLQYKVAHEYFRSKFEGEEIDKSLIEDYKKKTVSSKSSKLMISLGDEFSCSIVEQFARGKGISENTLFLGAFSYALGKYSGQSKSIFCTVNNGRHGINLAQSTGMFVRTLPIYCCWNEDILVETYLQEFQNDFYEVMEHDCISFAELAIDYGIAANILFVYQGEMLSGLTLNGRQYSAQPLDKGNVQADILVMVIKNREGYEVSLEYRTDLYREETAKGLLTMLRQILKGMLVCKSLNQIVLVCELDRQILDYYNETRMPYDKSLTIVDSIGRRVPVGVPGELCISGYQVSRGYLNRPEKTDEAYGKIPLNQNQKVNRWALPAPEREMKDVLLSNAFNGAFICNKDMKEYDTVEKLEQFLLEKQQNEVYEKRDVYPLTQMQNRIFVECAANPLSTIYNIPFLFKLGENVDLLRLKKAIEDTVDAHSYIKTKLYMDDNGCILQRRNDNLPYDVEILHTMSKEKLVKPFRLLNSHLFCIKLYDILEGKYLFLEFHHIISDGESCSIFIKDINRAYDGEPLNKEEFSGYEYALVEQNKLNGNEYKIAKKYYDSIFKGCDTDFLPVKDYMKDKQSLGLYNRISAIDMEMLTRFCRDKKITINTLFTAAFGFVTGRYMNKGDAVFTTVYNGRNDSRLVSAVSMLVKILPVYCSLDGEKDIETYLKDTEVQIINSMNNEIYSFAEISRTYGIKADLMFAFHRDNFEFDEIAGEKAVSEKLSKDTSIAPLSIDVVVKGDKVLYKTEYRSDMYKESTVSGFIDNFITVVQQMQYKNKLKEICMLSDKARKC